MTEQGVREGKLIRLHVPEVRIDIWKQLLYHRNKWISQELKAVIDYFQAHG